MDDKNKYKLYNSAVNRHATRTKEVGSLCNHDGEGYEKVKKKRNDCSMTLRHFLFLIPITARLQREISKRPRFNGGRLSLPSS